MTFSFFGQAGIPANSVLFVSIFLLTNEQEAIIQPSGISAPLKITDRAHIHTWFPIVIDPSGLKISFVEIFWIG